MPDRSRTPSIGSEDHAQLVDILQSLTAAAYHTGQGIFCDQNRKSGFFDEEAVDVAQQCAPSSDDHAALGDIRPQFRRGLLEYLMDGADDVVQGVGEGLEDLVAGNGEGTRDSFRQVASLDLDFPDLRTRKCGADSFLICSAVVSPISMP